MLSANSYGTNLGEWTPSFAAKAQGWQSALASMPFTPRVGGYSTGGVGPTFNQQPGSDDDEWLQQHMKPTQQLPQQQQRIPYGIYGDFARNVMPFGGQRQTGGQPFNLFATMLGRR